MTTSLCRVEKVARRRGAFGLDERRRPDPARVEAELRVFLACRLPEVWPLATRAEPVLAPDGSEPGTPGHTLALLLPRGHVAMLRIEAKPEQPGATARALMDRCRAMRIPHAVVSSLAEGRAALRRFGVEPRPAALPLQAIRGRT